MNTPSTYTVRGLWDIAKSDTEPLEYLWNGIALIPGAIVEMIGSPGIGKSRFIADLAKHQILGRDFGGKPTLKRHLKWLFIGTENGIHRLDREAKAFFFGCKPSEVQGMDEAARIEKAIANGFTTENLASFDCLFRTFTLEAPEDFDISLASDSNAEKLTATLAQEKPAIVCFDPWGDTIAGDELKDGDVRETIRIIRRIEKEAGLEKVITIIINHARIGAKEEALARGMDAGNFGKNSKCLYSIARYVLNIRRGSFDSKPPIEVICAKTNDGEPPSPVAFELDPGSMSYKHIADFDHDAWQAALEEKAGIKSRSTASQSATEEAIKEAVQRVCASMGSELITASDFKKAVMAEVGGKKTAVENYLAAAYNVSKTLARTPKAKQSPDGSFKRDGSKEVVGTPEAVATYQRTHPIAGKDTLI